MLYIESDFEQSQALGDGLGESMLSFDDVNIVSDTGHSANDSKLSQELLADSVAFIRSNLTSFRVLDRSEERGAALRMDHCRKAMAILVVTHQRGAQEILEVAKSAVTRGLKKRSLDKESHYFSLRRELDDLASVKDNYPPLMSLIDSLPNRDMSGLLAVEIKDTVLSVDWPGPLLVALSKRYLTQKSSVSTLDSALEAFFGRFDDFPSTTGSLESAHQSQINYYAELYVRERNKLVNHNLRLVYHIAKRYAQLMDYLPDLVQEGAFGLLRAAEKYRLSAGYRFSTYAHQWIESKVRKARVNIDKIMPISHDYNNELLKLSQSIEKCKIKNTRPSILNLSEESGLSPERVSALMQLKQFKLSMDESPGYDETPSLHGKLADPQSNFTGEILEEQNADYINFVMESVLTSREKYVLDARFGRIDGEPKTLQGISDIMGVSRERIRQLEVGALQKLHTAIDDSVFARRQSGE